MIVAATGVAARVLSSVGLARAAEPPSRPRGIKAIAFDAFPIFDPRPIVSLADEIFPGRGNELGTEWRTRQFEYAWLRIAGRRYADFWKVTRDALVFSAGRLGLELRPRDQDRLMDAYLNLRAWPDVAPALDRLKKSGLRLALLSNFSPAMLDGCVKSAGLAGIFDHALSTDRAKTYKPDPRAYQLGIDVLGLRREEILFVAHAGWDAAGAKWFGYPTFWVNRLKLPKDELDVTPDGSGGALSDLVRFMA